MRQARRLLSAGSLILAAHMAGGCAALLVGSTAAGYIFGVGTIEERVALPANELYDRAEAVAQHYGKIIHQDERENRRRIKFRYYASTVWVEITPLQTPGRSRIEVAARNEVMMLEDEVARTIFKYIVPDPSLVLEKPKRQEEKPANEDLAPARVKRW